MRNWFFAALLLLACGSGELAAAEVDVVPPPPLKRVVIGNEVATFTVSTYRASLAKASLRGVSPVKLPSWRQTLDESDDAELQVLDLFNEPSHPAGWAFIDMHNYVRGMYLREHGGAAEPPWTIVEQTDSSVTLRHQLREVRRSGENSVELAVDYEIRYQMHPQRPSVEVFLQAINRSSVALETQPQLVLLNGLHQDDPTHEGIDLAVVAHYGGLEGFGFDKWSFPEVGQEQVISFDEPDDSTTLLLDPSRLDYVGLKSRFFAALWKPGAFGVKGEGGAGGTGALEADPTAPPSGLQEQTLEEAMQVAGRASTPAAADANYRLRIKAIGYRQQLPDGSAAQAALFASFLAGGGASAFTLQPGQRLEGNWQLTVTSTRDEHLALLNDAEREIEYTDSWYRFFRTLVAPLNWLLKWLEAITGHYAIALILLVILIKAALHRINIKTQTSMMKMQKLGPELKRLQQQYKNDRQTAAAKQMELFKKEGVNPVGGCLPLLLQMPIFVALYQLFRHSADARGQGFLWVDDLTLPDQLFQIWGWLTLNPLPLIYIAVAMAMSFSAKPAPNTEMTDQARQMQTMMRWMPVAFGLFFYNMPAGLVLYFTISAMISYLEMRYIRKKLGLSGGMPTV